MELTPNKESSEYENSIYEERVKAIQAMPEGAAKEKAIADLSRDYDGREAAARDEFDVASSDFSAAMDPLAMRKGPSGNPFAVDTAPHALEQVGRGMNLYNSGKDKRAARAERSAISEGRKAATEGLIGGGIDSMSEAERKRLMREKEIEALRDRGGSFGH